MSQPNAAERLISNLTSIQHMRVLIVITLGVWAGGWILNQPAPAPQQPEPRVVIGPVRQDNPKLEWTQGNWTPARDNIIRRHSGRGWGFNQVENQDADGCRYVRVHCADAYVMTDRAKTGNVAIWGRVRTRDVGRRPFGPGTQVYQVTIEDQPKDIYEMPETEWERVPYGLKLQINSLCEKGRDRGHIAFYRTAVVRGDLLLGDALDCVLWQRGWTMPKGWKVLKDTDQWGDYPLLSISEDKPWNGNFPFQRDE